LFPYTTLFRSDCRHHLENRQYYYQIQADDEQPEYKEYYRLYLSGYIFNLHYDPLKRVFTEQDEFFADTAVLFTMTYKYCKFSVHHIDLSNSLRQHLQLHHLLLDQSGGISQIFIQSLVDEQIEYFLDFKTIVDEISELS